MVKLDPTRFRTPPFKHQLEGTRKLVERPAFALFDEMGVGKSKQVVDAACALFEARALDAVVVVAPASVRGVWLDPDLGEIRRHAWVETLVHEYHQKSGCVWGTADAGVGLPWFVTNYEFLRPIGRDDRRLRRFIEIIRGYPRVLLVLDESSRIKNHRAAQHKAVLRLRQECTRCVLLNGTPISNNPLDLWPQLQALDPKILGRRYANFWHFRAAHARLGGWQGKQVLGWQDLEQVQRLIAPHCLRRLKQDCLDLPEKLYTQREVALKLETWRLYQELRRDALMSLPDREVVIEPNAAVRLLRLAQLTSGHVGVPAAPPDATPGLFVDRPETRVQDVSSEKLDWLAEELAEWCEATAVIVWCRWRRERERLKVGLSARKNVETWELYGGQGQAEREEAIKMFSRSTLAGAPLRVLLAQPQAGGYGLNLTAAHRVYYLSNDYSLATRLQSEDRCHRPGQTRPVTYVDVLATGPAGQRTVDHAIWRALRAKRDLAELTAAAWRRELEDE